MGTAMVADVLEMTGARMAGIVAAVGGLVGVRAGGGTGAGVPVADPVRRIGGGAGGGKRAPGSGPGGGVDGGFAGGAAESGGGAAGGGSGAREDSGGLVGIEPGGFVMAGARETGGMGGGTMISVLAEVLTGAVAPGGITTPMSVLGLPGSGGGAPVDPGAGGGMLSHPLSISIDSPLSRSPSSSLPVLSSLPATTGDATQDAVQAKRDVPLGVRRHFIGCAAKKVNISSLATMSLVSLPAKLLADSPPGHWWPPPSTEQRRTVAPSSHCWYSSQVESPFW